MQINESSLTRDGMKGRDRVLYRSHVFGLGGGEISRHWTLGKAPLLAVASCEEQRRAEVMSKHTASSRAQKRGGWGVWGTGNTSALPLIQTSAAQHATHLGCPLCA